MFPVSIKGVLRLPSNQVVLALNDRDEWELPGGRIELNESASGCLAREFKEELDVDVTAGAILDSYLFEVIPGKHVFIVTYGCTLVDKFDPKVSAEHSRIATFAIDALPPNLPAGYVRSIHADYALPS